MIQRLIPDDIFEIASTVSGQPSAKLRRAALSVGLIDSALHAPFAGFGAHDEYESFETKVGVLGYRLLKAHGLPDWNKRTAIAAMEFFAQINGYQLVLDEDTAFEATVAAAANTIDEQAFVGFVASNVCANPKTRA